MTTTQTYPSSGFRIGSTAVQLFVAVALALPYVGGFPLAYVLVLATAGFTVWLMVRARDFTLAGGLAAWLFPGAYGALVLAFCLTAKQPADLSGAVNFIMLPFFYPLVSVLRRFSRPSNASCVALCGLAGSFLAFAVALYQVWGAGMQRAEGLFSDAIWSADAALVLGFVSVIGVNAGTGRWRTAFLAGPVLAVLVVILSGSRGPLLAVPLLLAIASVTVFRRWRMALLLGAASLCVLVPAMLALWPQGAARFWTLVTLSSELASGQTPSEASGAIRLSLTQGAWQAFLASPWVGHGWGRFAEVIAQYVGQFNLAPTERQFHLHSDLGNFAVGAGVLGILAYLAILFAPFAGALASPRDSQFRSRVTGTALLGSAYLLCGLTNTLFGFEFHTTLYVCLAAILLGFCQDSPEAAAR